MTTEQMNAFQTWWNKSSIACDKGTDCRDAFASGWEAAFGSCPMTADEIIHIARQNERDAIEKKLLAMAGAAFVAGKDDHAHWFRALVNVLFKNPGANEN